MNVASQNRTFEVGRIGWVGIVFGVLAGALPLLAADTAVEAPAPAAGASPVTSSRLTTVAAPSSQNKKLSGETAAVGYSAGLEDIFKLVEAGVSKDVIKSFIERSPIPYRPSAAEVIALKERGVSDEVTTALLRRGEEVMKQSARTKGPVAAPAIVRDLSTGGHLDPESYDFWFYHYSYPRALAYSYQTLTPYAHRYSYGYGRRFSPYFQFSPPRKYFR